MMDQLVNWGQAEFCRGVVAVILPSWNIHGVKQEKCQVKNLLDLEDLSGTFFGRGEGAQECHKIDQIILAELDIFIVFAYGVDLRRNFLNKL